MFLECGNNVTYHFFKNKKQQDTEVILWDLGIISCTLFYTSEAEKLKYVKYIFTIKIWILFLVHEKWFLIHCVFEEKF